MLNIRNNVFETNSSSSHSVSLVTSDGSELLESFVPDENGNIVLKGGDFSYTEKWITSTIDKLNFVAVYFHAYYDPELKERFERVVKEHTGAAEIIYDIRLQVQDQQSANSFLSTEYAEPSSYYSENELRVTLDNIFNNDDLLKMFLFNKKFGIEANIENC